MNDTVPPPRADFSKQLSDWFNTLGAQRYGGHFLLFAVAIGVIGFGQMNPFRLVPTQVDVNVLAVSPAAEPTAMPDPGFALLAPLATDSTNSELTRHTELHTYIPDRKRFDITTYTAQDGDTILGIAEKFGLTPETIVFSNPILNNNPHFLEPGQTLRIPPANGLIRDVIAGDTIAGLAKVYKVTPEDIINWPSNNIDPENPQISVGQAVFVPNGDRGTLNIQGQPPSASGSSSSSSGSSNSGGASAQPKAPWVLNSGSGACPGGYTGGVAGSGGFIFPTNHHWVSGYNYSGIHLGIDLDGDTGDPAYAADSGVVVFAGWSDWGYGNTIVIDHGNNWWTLYGHLSQIFVQCGQGVYQGNQIGAIGNTGRSQGSHLHFEIYYGVYQTNPWGVLPPP
jgi:murein DD-endopeptidase MepM/ murein hydrolase activator NlpD